MLEITDAGGWAGFVSSNARAEGGLLYPDWESAARRWDGIHMTLRAIAATQGLLLGNGQDLIAAPFWDVESTLWLRWRFHGADLIETVSTR